MTWVTANTNTRSHNSSTGLVCRSSTPRLSPRSLIPQPTLPVITDALPCELHCPGYQTRGQGTYLRSRPRLHHRRLRQRRSWDAGSPSDRAAFSMKLCNRTARHSRVAALGVVVAAVTALTPSASAVASTPSLKQMIGQKLVVSMDGSTPSASLLERARWGRIGGVLIHRYNFSLASAPAGDNEQAPACSG